MEFCLHYYEKLRSRDNAAGKHSIREALQGQMKAICESEPFANTFEANTKDVQQGQGLPLYVDLGTRRYWFNLSRKTRGGSKTLDLNEAVQ